MKCCSSCAASITEGEGCSPVTIIGRSFSMTKAFLAEQRTGIINSVIYNINFFISIFLFKKGYNNSLEPTCEGSLLSFLKRIGCKKKDKKVTDKRDYNIFCNISKLLRMSGFNLYFSCAFLFFLDYIYVIVFYLEFQVIVYTQYVHHLLYGNQFKLSGDLSFTRFSLS